MTIYIETSAAAKLLADEPESDALLDYLEGLADDEIYPVSSILLETELRRIGRRDQIDQGCVSDVLVRFSLLEADRSVFIDAGLLHRRWLRSLDAIHIATAIRAEADQFLTYDHRQAASARDAGIRVIAPGTQPVPSG